MNNRMVYAEVYSFLTVLDKSFVECIPPKIINTINTERDPNYIIKYDLDIPLSKQKISKEAISIIAVLHYKYWCKSKIEKNRLNKVFSKNSEIIENEKKAKYSYENLFKNEKKPSYNVKLYEEKGDIQIYKKSIIDKIKEAIGGLFRKKE